MLSLKFFKSSVTLIALSLSLTAFGKSPSVDVAQGASMQSQGALMIDVREPSEYAAGHAPGTQLIPLGQLESRLQELAAHKDKPVVLICRSGSRSGQAQELMAKAGFTQALNVEGGMNAWVKAGLPVLTGPASK
ncbi:rhodanese-like domain-containing protein [Rhodoferax sp. U2-2l]|uniref:rhodanese-like domain-containing protein n=1 Tax=Rhodoferax sp. U2-2l TaxID=2884000 RepID=UPI001D0B2B92|nr:rhodanese-like domain-containing protein [Rhodoferax sp. U2-2l]MCB8746007.1 rhodanese-like domain-containing protein [Rhodoferax sp. U2-2l]